jgi:cobalt-precorrin 5A hydrolase
MIVAGFGFRTGAQLSSLEAACQLASHGQGAVTHLATVADKVEALAPLARAMGLPIRSISPDELTRMATFTASAASMAARNTGSVAEASALAAAGAGAVLLAPRQLSPDKMASCAIAQGSLP